MWGPGSIPTITEAKTVTMICNNWPNELEADIVLVVCTWICIAAFFIFASLLLCNFTTWGNNQHGCPVRCKGLHCGTYKSWNTVQGWTGHKLLSPEKISHGILFRDEQDICRSALKSQARNPNANYWKQLPIWKGCGWSDRERQNGDCWLLGLRKRKNEMEAYETC